MGRVYSNCIPLGRVYSNIAIKWVELVTTLPKITIRPRGTIANKRRTTSSTRLPQSSGFISVKELSKAKKNSNFSNIFRNFFKKFRDSNFFFETLSKNCRKCSTKFRKISKIFQKMFRKFSENFEKFFENFRIFFRKILKNQRVHMLFKILT